MRLLSCCVLIGLGGCLGFEIEPGALACEPSAPACPGAWQCMVGATGRAACYPEGQGPRDDGGVADGPKTDGSAADGSGADGSGADGIGPDGALLVGPAGAPAFTPTGKVFHLDPKAGKTSNSGASKDQAWGSLEQVVKAGLIEQRDKAGAIKRAGEVADGDTLLLYDGEHGAVDLTGYYNTKRINVVAAPGAAPHLSGLVIGLGSGWRFQGLRLTEACNGKSKIVDLGGLGSGIGVVDDVALIGNTISSATDRSGWTVADWKANTCEAIMMSRVTNVTIAFNEVLNVKNAFRGFSCRGITVEGNHVDGFSGKAIAGSANSDLTIVNNMVVNAFDASDSSMSMIHLGACDSGCKGTVIRGNRLLRVVDDGIPAERTGVVQGIVLFDGPHEDVTIVNNLVVGDHWHGITVLDGSNVSIFNNTVVGGLAKVGTPTFSWIQVTGSALSTVAVHNNLTGQVDVGGAAKVSHNGIIDAPDKFFADWKKGDYRLRAGSPAVDQGRREGAPTVDLAGNPRDDSPDQGAYELVP